MKKTPLPFLALALLLPTQAWAQCNGVFANNTVCGNVTGSANLPRPTNPSAFLGAAGGTNGQIQYNNAGALGGFTMSGDVATVTSTGVATIQPNAVTNSKINPGAADTMKGSLNGTTTSDIALISCSVAYRFTQWVTGTGWQCGISPVLPSRTIAASLDLSAFSAITTQGYTNPGDGGGATYAKQAVGAALIDYSVTAAPTITGNGTSGCTNATYRNVVLASATGANLVVTITVSGNVVTSVALSNYGGNKYLAGQALSTSITGCSTTVTFTVPSVTTPTCSFFDSASSPNPFQLVANPDGAINVKQCGAKVDITTNDVTAFRNAMNFAGLSIGNSPDNGGTLGSTVVIPQGVMAVCDNNNTIVVPNGVSVIGQGMTGTVISVCDTLVSSTTPFTLCDANSQASCFGTFLANLQIFQSGSPTSDANIPMVFTNALQQSLGLYRVAIYPRNRGCLRYDLGYGGAATFGMDQFFCTIGGTNPGINFTNVGTTMLILTNSVVEAGGGGVTANGIQITGGFLNVTNFHTERISTGIFVDIPASNVNGVVQIINASGGSNCTSLVTQQNGSAADSLVIQGLTANGCTNTYTESGVGSGAVVVAGQLVF